MSEFWKQKSSAISEISFNVSALVVIELKKGKFKPAYLGQLNFYLSALDEQERKN